MVAIVIADLPSAMRHHLVSLALAAAPAPALLMAQYPRVDVAFGVSMNGPADVNRPPKCNELALPCISPKTFPDPGIVAQGTLHVTRYAAIVAEASAYDNMWVAVGENRSRANHVSAMLLGAQLTTGRQTFATRVDTVRYRVFAQLLGGSERSDVVPARQALQPGIGLDGKLKWAPGWVRVEWDYRSTRGSPRNLSGSRVSLALAVDAGKG